MEHIIYIYLIINGIITGYYYGDSIRANSDLVISIVGLAFALPFIIICFIIEFFLEGCRRLDGYFQISFIWQIRGNYWKNVPEDKLEQLAKIRRKFILDKKPLKWVDKRGLYCIDKILKLNNFDINSKEITKEEIVRLINNKNNPIILDIGTYDGKDAKEIASFYEECSIHCFEADERSRAAFFNNISINFSNKKIKTYLYPLAISNIDGEIEFYQSDSDTRRHEHNPDSWSASGSIKKPKEHLDLFPDVKFKEKVKVKSIRLDTWYNSHLDPFPIDFIWADVNGGEKELIEGGLQTLNNHTRFLYIEFSDKELYEQSVNKEGILKLLPEFELIDTYNYQGNFGNILLRNKSLNK